MTNITIRQAEPSEAKQLTRIIVSAKRHWGYPEEWMLLWGEMLEISAEFIIKNPVWVADTETENECDGEVLGFTAISATHPTAELEHLWVCPKQMQKGIGAKLMNVVKAHCQLNGISQLQIKSDPNAKAFYEKQGAVYIRDVPSIPEPRVLPELVLFIDGQGK